MVGPHVSQPGPLGNLFGYGGQARRQLQSSHSILPSTKKRERNPLPFFGFTSGLP